MGLILRRRDSWCFDHGLRFPIYELLCSALIFSHGIANAHYRKDLNWLCN